MRTLILGLLLGFVVGAYGQIIDPNVGFCAAPATHTSCTTATGAGGETILINSTTSFGMWSNGSQDSNAPWYLLLAVPDDSGGAPSITSASFTQIGATTDAGQFLRTTGGDIYTFADTALGITLNGDSSMRAANLFCDGAGIPCLTSNEITAFGSLPTFFEIYAYKFSPGFLGNTAYAFSSSGLAAGSFLAALAIGGSNNNIQFSTPYTTTGLITGGGGGDEGGPVPEPSTMLLLGSVLLIGCAKWRKRLGRTA